MANGYGGVPREFPMIEKDLAAAGHGGSAAFRAIVRSLSDRIVEEHERELAAAVAAALNGRKAVPSNGQVDKVTASSAADRPEMARAATPIVVSASGDTFDPYGGDAVKVVEQVQNGVVTVDVAPHLNGGGNGTGTPAEKADRPSKTSAVSVREPQSGDEGDGDSVRSEVVIGESKSEAMEDGKKKTGPKLLSIGPTKTLESAATGGRPYEVLHEWSQDGAPTVTAGGEKFSKAIRMSDNSVEDILDDDDEEKGETIEATGPLSRFIAYPSSPYRLVWDVSGMILIGYDIITIPLGVFSAQSDLFFVFFNWVTRIFWTLDMLASLMVGYVSEGITIMSPKMILLHYLKTWFVVDCIVNIPDWLGVVLAPKDAGDDADGSGGGGGGGASSVTRLVRILRIMRILRLLRLAKLKRIMNELYDRIDSEYMSIIMNIIRLMTLLLVINHFIACIWFWIGDFQRQDGGARNWVTKWVDGETWGYQYGTSLHWSLTQFTPASMHVQPENLSERTFAILVLLVALLTFSSLLGSITSSMTQLRSMREDSWKQFWLLRRYLRQRGVPRTLGVRIERYLEFKRDNQKSEVPSSKVQILSLLSEQLNDELQCAITLPFIEAHPLFRHISETWHMTMNRLSRAAISRKSLARNDTLFFVGDMCACIYFVVSGELHYTTRDDDDGILVTTECYMCEPVLWTYWRHRGELQATTECDLILIDAKNFHKVIFGNPLLWADVANYAHRLVEWLNQEENLCDVYETAEMSKTVRKLMDRQVRRASAISAASVEGVTRLFR
eukprot:TRINITY_DN21108_c0_g1_i3.p1 TRINITY_DN21108_c0_g1~~TRINITY_DN21108_c0_g1_i3.p1  ORF type:complete len:784 (-),score=182.65 TRINITY_DN21108_c0_g1_i3:170-2521(-)